MRRGKKPKRKTFSAFLQEAGRGPGRTAGSPLAGAYGGPRRSLGRSLSAPGALSPGRLAGAKIRNGRAVPDFCMGARKNRAGRRRYPQGACRRGGRDSQNAQVELPAARAGRQRTAGACAGMTGGRRAQAPVPAAANKNGPGCKNAARPVFCIRYFLFAVFPGFVFWGCAVCACAASSSGFKNWPV